MTDELLPYYNNELAFIRELAAEFAQAHPGVASRLRMDRDLIEDPHVSRLIEAFAFLNARTRLKIDDEFPEISESLLQVLYPHYLQPLPSACIVQMKLDATHSELVTGHTLPRGEMLETEPIDQHPCRFQTCYPLTLWPMEIAQVSYQGPPFRQVKSRISERAEAALQVTLRCLSPKLQFAAFASMDRIRFYLHGQTQHTSAMYEHLMNDAVGLRWTSNPLQDPGVDVDTSHIHAVGFGRDEGMLPYSARSFLGYRLLTEYFAFPEKFHFIDVQLPDRQRYPQLFNSRQLSLVVFFRSNSTVLERYTKEEMFQLGCTPVVNLFTKRAEPIRITQKQTEYRVVPDSRRPLAHEVYSVDRVVATSPDQQKIEFTPFYSLRHPPTQDGQGRAFWHAMRRGAGYAAGQPDDGTEVYLTLVDLDMQPSGLTDWTLDVMTTCLNRDLPRRLPFGGGQPRVQLTNAGSLARPHCLTAPTPTYRPALRRGTVWQLISHLSLNPLSLVSDQDGAEPMREILRLYDFADSPTTRAEIDGLLNVSARRAVGRTGSEVSAGFCRGLEVQLKFQEDAFAGRSFFLLSVVLERFFALYSSVNSFTRTVVTTDKREGIYRMWPPRAGERILL